MPILAAGNTLVLKPSELSPRSAVLPRADMAGEAGFPAGVFNVADRRRDTATGAQRSRRIRASTIAFHRFDPEPGGRSSTGLGVAIAGNR